MQKETKSLKSTDILERERERELYSRKIGFICDAKTNCNASIKSSKKITKKEYIIKKWVDYEKQEKSEK